MLLMLAPKAVEKGPQRTRPEVEGWPMQAGAGFHWAGKVGLISHGRSRCPQPGSGWPTKWEGHPRTGDPRQRGLL